MFRLRHYKDGWVKTQTTMICLTSFIRKLTQKTKGRCIIYSLRISCMRIHSLCHSFNLIDNHYKMHLILSQLRRDSIYHKMNLWSFCTNIRRWSQRRVIVNMCISLIHSTRKSISLKILLAYFYWRTLVNWNKPSIL